MKVFSAQEWKVGLLRRLALKGSILEHNNMR